MDIQYIKSNISKSPQDGIVKFLFDLLFQDINDVENYEEKSYFQGDRVYLEENGKHQIYKCIVDVSSNTFVRDEWEYIMEVYEGQDEKVYNLRMQEEVHIIDNNTINGIRTNLEFTDSNSTVAIYKGKHRLVRDYDFKIVNRSINFVNPLNVGDRIILEVREVIKGVNLEVAMNMYDMDGNPYRVVVTNNGAIQITPTEYTENDIRHVNIVSGDRSYTMLVDSSVNPPKLGLYENIEIYLLGTDNIQYKLSVENEQVKLKADPEGLYDRHVIMGSDNKFYTLHNANGDIVVQECLDPELSPSDFEIGIRTIDDNHEPVIIDIVNGDLCIYPDSLVEVYNYISLMSDTGNVYLGINDNLDLVFTDDVSDVNGTISPLINELYFYDKNWKMYKLYYSNNELFCEEYNNDDIQLYDKGFKLLTHDGRIVKVNLDKLTDELNITRVVHTERIGTFNSPIEGYVVNDNGITKIATINKDTLEFELLETTDEFVQNDHFIKSVEGLVYKLEIENGKVLFNECDISEYDIDDIHEGNFIKNNDIIYRFDIINGNVSIIPISTFTHKIKDTEGNAYLVDIIGGYFNEELTFIKTDYATGDMYLKDEKGNVNKVILHSDLTMSFEVIDKRDDIDYDITSLIYSRQGWYKLSIQNNNIKFTKVFDNLFEENKSYGNLVRKDLVLPSENNSKYSIHADGNGNVVVKPYYKPNNMGTLLNSDNGHIFALGVFEEELVSYKSFVSKNLSENKVYLRDINTNKVHSLFVKDDVLYSDIAKSTLNEEVVTLLPIYDAYKNRYKLQMIDGKLFIDLYPEDKIDSDLVYDLSLVLYHDNKYYGLGVVNNNLVFKETEKGESIAVDEIYLQDMIDMTNYKLFTDGVTLYIEQVNRTNGDAYTGYSVYDNKGNVRRVQVVDGQLTLL